MAELKYPVIKSREQYYLYCDTLEKLLTKPKQTKKEEDEIELLTTLIEVWDQQHSKTKQLDPIQLLRSFMKDHKLKPLQTMKIMGISSRGHLYEILNYQKGLSKEVIRNLAAYFKVSQEAFNQPYTLKKLPVKAASKHPVVAKPSAKKNANNRKTIVAKLKQPRNKNTVSRSKQLQSA